MNGRGYRLEPWLVRALIPERTIGAYVLYVGGRPNYIGRSDRDLQQRLIQHAGVARGEFFTYDVLWHPLAAYEVECSLYHALNTRIENLVHPGQPDYLRAECPFCPASLDDALSNRLTPAPQHLIHTTAETEISRLSKTQGATR